MPVIHRYYHSLPHLSHAFSRFFYSKAVFTTAFRADVIFDSFCRCNSSFICCTEDYKKRYISTTKTLLQDRHDMHEERHLTSSSSCIESDSKNENFLHISPSGDFWFGTTIFAAKHLPPNYIKSIRIPHGKKFEGKLLEFMSNASMDVLHVIYDNGSLPDSFHFDPS